MATQAQLGAAALLAMRAFERAHGLPGAAIEHRVVGNKTSAYVAIAPDGSEYGIGWLG